MFRNETHHNVGQWRTHLLALILTTPSEPSVSYLRSLAHGLSAPYVDMLEHEHIFLIKCAVLSGFSGFCPPKGMNTSVK